MDWKNIYEGWRNHLFPPEKLREFLKQLSEARLQECRPCAFNTTKGSVKEWSRCKECGCALIAKSKAPAKACGIGKWKAVATPGESEAIIRDAYD
jgi:hypothetical protein